MNKEIPSVEELINWAAIEAHFIAVTEDGYDQSVPKLRALINQAITQHTAELQRENERLKTALKITEQANLLHREECNAAIGNWQKYESEAISLQNQLTEAQSQLVVLREALEVIHSNNLETLAYLNRGVIDKGPAYFIEHFIPLTLSTTQPTPSTSGILKLAAAGYRVASNHSSDPEVESAMEYIIDFPAQSLTQEEINILEGVEL